MKQICLFIIACFCLSLSLEGQTSRNNAKVTDFRVDQGNGAVVITYDLNQVGKYRLFNIRVEGTLDGEKLRINSLGKTKDIRAGSNNEVVWYAEKDDYKELRGRLGFNVIGSNPLDRDMDGVGDIDDKCPNEAGDCPNGCANINGNCNEPPPCTMSLPATAGLGGVAAGGLGLLIAGASKAAGVEDGEVYQLYKNHTDPNDPVFQENGYTNRQAAFDEVNKEYKNGGYLAIAGGAVIGVAAGIWILRKINCNKNDGYGYSQPRLKPTFKVGTGNQPVVGIGLTYTFK